MGVVRLLLALSVLIGHSTAIYGYTAISGRAAVQAFYMISGFYMAMVFSKKYQYKSVKFFYLSRYLRLIPLYIVVAFISWLFYIKTNYSYDLKIAELLDSNLNLTFLSSVWIIFSNLTLLGIDSLFFMAIDGSGELYFTSTVRQELLPAYNLSLLPQSWSLGIELLFYLFVPFLFRLNNKWLIYLIAFSLLSRIVLFVSGNYFDPWTYRFFGFEIALFLSGALSYRIYEKIPRFFINKKFQLIAFLVIILFILFFRIVKITEEEGAWILNIFLFICLPAIFFLTKNSRLDSILGHLSYPVYVFHYLFIVVLDYYKIMTGLSVMLATLIASILWYFLCDVKIEKIRANL